MNIRILAGLTLASLFIASCDDATDGIGGSLTGTVDKLDIATDTFTVSTRSFVADSVLSRNSTGYLGKVRDPETGAYLTSDFMTQFYCPEGYALPNKDSIQSFANGDIACDSCDIRLYYTTYYGDSLAAMKLSAYELSRPIAEQKNFYSNFDPEQENYVKQGDAMASLMYTIADLNVDEATRQGSEYMPSIRIPLDQPYGGYNNFGTYIMHQYYAHPEYFKNAYTFINKLVPGFYIRTSGGLGSMAYVSLSQLNIYFRNKTTTTLTDGTKRDTIVTSMASFPGTEEVLQLTNIQNDRDIIQDLADNEHCTYLKTPAGIFTEMTLPVEEIVAGHERDTINTAKVELTRINNTHTGDYELSAPTTLLMVPKAEMYDFFEKSRVADYKTTFLATLSTTSNTYTFNNIGSLIKYLHTNGDRSNPDWNKVMVIPVSTTYATINNQRVLTGVTHDMSMTATRLVGGPKNERGDIKISVIYSKFK